MVRHLLEFLLHAKRIGRIQSPLAKSLIAEVLPHKPTLRGKEIEALRQQLCGSDLYIQMIDYGAGSRTGNTNEKKKSVAQLARKSARKYYQGEFLMRLCQYYQPQRCLEFGTNLGISTLYQLSGLNQGRFITMEGDPSLAALAQKHIDKFQFSAEIMVGEFSEILRKQLHLADYQPDYVFLDGNHRYESTIKYVEQLLPTMPTDSILILDDINWSKGMRKAWREVTQKKEISLSLDLFSMGICFIKGEQSKENIPVMWPGLLKFML